MTKINNFQADLTNISTKKEPLAAIRYETVAMSQNGVGILLDLHLRLSHRYAGSMFVPAGILRSLGVLYFYVLLSVWKLS